MARLSEFEYGKLPEVMYHGAGKSDRSSIEAEGLLGGHVTPHLELAAEYTGPDLWEVRKHPSMTKAEGWEPDDAVWAGNVPSTHVKRVGHAIWHQGGTNLNNEIHWHKAENCPLGYDTTWEKGDPEAMTDFENVRPHPTDPTRMVGNY
jgi:hypothetical protein